MKHALSALALVLAPAALAHTPEHGDMSDHIELVVDRAVTFKPMADHLHILTVADGRAIQIPRVDGEVAVAMSFNNEGGTILEFNNGLDYNFDYDLHFVNEEGEHIAPEFPVCTVGSNRVGTEHWPQPYAKIVISNFRRTDGFNCPAG